MSRRPFFSSLMCLMATGLLVLATGTTFASNETTAPQKATGTTQTSATQTGAAIECARLVVGFGGSYRAGTWTPVTVTLNASDEAQPVTGTVQLTVPDGDGVPSLFESPDPVTVLPGRSVDVQMIVRYGRIDNTTRVALVSKQGVSEQEVSVFETEFHSGQTADYPRALPSASRLIVALGKRSSGEEAAARLAAEPEERQTSVARLTTTDSLPSRWIGYEGVDTLVLTTGEPDALQGLLKNPARLTALERWVRRGGKLLILAGRDAEGVLQNGSPLSRLLPGRFESVIRLRQSRALEYYADSPAPLQSEGGGRIDVPAVRLADPTGPVEVLEADLPLVIRRKLGFGQVTFLGVDTDTGPFVGWKGRGPLLARLLGLPRRPVERLGGSGAMMHFGYNDLIGQLRSALDRFPDVKSIPLAAILLTIFVYLILIGPGDFFFVKRVLRRMGATWITFPLLIILFSVGAYATAVWLKGDRVRVHRAELVDIDWTTGAVQGTCWANLLSPSDRHYNLSIQPALKKVYPEPPTSDETSSDQSGASRASTERYFAWLGLPGSGFGGMDPKTTGMTVWPKPYRFTKTLDSLEKVPVQIWSTKSFVGRWSAQLDSATNRLSKFQLRRRDELPVGRITNPLSVPLVDCLLVFDRWAYTLGRLEPGQTKLIDGVENRSELQTLLTGRRLVTDEEKKLRPAVTPFDQTSLDPKYLLRIMSFYEKAGGQQYTHLLNRAEPWVDWSHLTGPDRAILLGWTEDADYAATDWTVDGQPISPEDDTHQTMFRFLLPVEAETK